jgi:Ca2+-binding RTX toxin-like protein
MAYVVRQGFASYSKASGGVTASLGDPSKNTGEAVGDTYPGISSLEGSAFDDVLIGNASDNRLVGGPGADRLEGGSGIDLASYQFSATAITTSLADPALNTGEAAGDTYVGIEGLVGSDFDDTLVGNSGDNILEGGAGADHLDGGSGGDYASYRSSPIGLTVSLANPSANTGEASGDSYVSIERLEGSAFDDVLTGDAADNVLRGNGGADRLDGGAGFDYASYFNSAVAIKASLADPSLNSGEAAGDIYVSIEGLTGSVFDDILIGDAANNFLTGQGGADVLDGGGGFDHASYANATAGITVSLANPGANTGEAFGDTYISIEGLLGSSFNDVLIGDAATNVLRGGLGADRLDGGGGFDYAGYSSAAAGVTASLADTSLNTGEAAGDVYISIEGLQGSNFADTLIGNAADNTIYDFAGNDTVIGGAGRDAFISGAGDDSYYGGGKAAGTGLDGSTDIVDYSQTTGLTQGIVVNWTAGTVVGQASLIGTDKLFQIEGIYGTAFDDKFDATGYTTSLAHAGDFSAYQFIRGGAGNDTIIGNFNTEAGYTDATSGITAIMTVFGTGTVTGGGVGTDKLTAVNRIVGSSFDDTFVGTDGAEIFDGYRGGNDVFHGAGGADLVEYDGASNNSPLSVKLAAGIVTDRFGATLIGTDTLDSIEQIRGSESDDLYDATGFSDKSVNVGSLGTFNQFEGQGGADTVIGNGNTRLAYFSASSGVTVTMTGIGAGTATAAYNGSAATDTFTGVAWVAGSNFNDSLSGAAGNDYLEGRTGDDTLDGGDGADKLDGGAGNDILKGGLGGDSLTGGAGNDVFRGTWAELEGDTITDYQEGDRIELLDVPAGAKFSVTKGSTIIAIDVDGDGVTEGKFTLSTDLDVLRGSGLQFVVSESSGVTTLQFRHATASIAAAGSGVAEGNAGPVSHSLMVSLDLAAAATETLDWAVSGTGANPADLADFGGALPSGKVTFLPGETTKTIIVDVSGDQAVEFDEGFAVKLSNPSTGLVLGTSSATSTIQNDDRSAVSVAPLAADVPEGNSGETAYTFTVSLNQAGVVTQTIDWSVSGNGAHPADAADFGGTLPSGSVTFAAGETSKTVTAIASADSAVELDETFSVALSNPSSGLTIGTASAVGTIRNDDASVSIATLSAAKAEGQAGSTSFTFTLTLTGDSSVARSVSYGVAGSGAAPADGSDFVGGVAPAGTVTFAAGETSKVVTVSVAGDTIVEADEGFAVALSNPSAGLAIGTESALGTIQNDDRSTVSVAAQAAVKMEGNSGTTASTFVISLNQAAIAAQTVNWAVTGTGANPASASDFAGGLLPAGTVTFAAGETSKVVTVSVAGDTMLEADEGFAMTLSNPSAGLLIGTALASGTILNDDTPVVAHGDAYIVKQGQVLAPTLPQATGVLANDENATTASLLDGPDHGTLQLVGNGTFTYTPAAGFSGVDTFTYQAGNAGASMDEAQVTIHVVPVSAGPTSTTLNLVGLTADEQIAATYAAFFGRGADAAGLEFWVGEFVHGLPTQGPTALFANIASSFGISAEAKALYPFLVDPFHASDGQINTFLTSVYDNLFNRTPDAAGRGYWTDQVKQTLQAGQFVGSVLVNIMSGAQDTVAGQDITTLMGKVAVSLAYVHEQREHETAWLPSDNAAARALLDAVTADPASVLIGVKNAEGLVAGHV